MTTTTTKQARVFAVLGAMMALAGCAVAAEDNGPSPVQPDLDQLGINASKKAICNSACTETDPTTFDHCGADTSGVCEHRAATHRDVSAGTLENSGRFPSVVVDKAGGKVLVVTEDQSNGQRLALFRCNIDGTGCAYSDISAGQGLLSGRTPSAVIDEANQRLLVATFNGANAHKPGLFRCALDGTGCTYVDISAGQGAFSGGSPVALIDTLAQKLLVVASNMKHPGLFRCELDGSACSYRLLSQTDVSDYAPSAAIDRVSGKLLVAITNLSNGNRPGLYRCELDGTGCSYADISARQGTDSGLGPSLAIDPSSNKLVVATVNGANAYKPALFECAVDGTGCRYTDISAGQGAYSGSSIPVTATSAAIDVATRSVFVATTNGANDGKPGLFKCAAGKNGFGNCSYGNLSSGQGPNSGLDPSAFLAPDLGKLFVATTNGANGNRASLFTVQIR